MDIHNECKRFRGFVVHCVCPRFCETNDDSACLRKIPKSSDSNFHCHGYDYMKKIVFARGRHRTNGNRTDFK